MIQINMMIGDEPTAEMIADAYKQYQKRLPAYKTYRDYYEGRHQFSKKDGAMVTVNLVRYGVDNLVSYMVGNPPKYTYEKDKDGEGNGKDSSKVEKIIQRFDRQNLREKEAEIVRNLKIFGRGFELVYHEDNKDKSPRSVMLSPEIAFVAYDMTIDPDSVFGAVVRTVKEGDKTVTYLDVYGPTYYREWKSDDGNTWTKTGNEGTTRFNRVPLIEYINSEDAMSEIANVLSIQDALNSVISDRQDDKDAFAGAMLVVYGQILGMTPEEITNSRNLLKELKVAQLEDKNSQGMEYLIKQMDEAGAQLYSDDLTSMIHKLMRVPDFSDEQFSGNSSGVAMAYKLYGTHNAAKITEHYFGRGFRRRCKLYDAGMNNAMQSEDAETDEAVYKMNIVFTYSTVVDPIAEAQAAVGYLSAGVSQETVLANISIVDDVAVEMERLRQQKDADAEREKRMYNDEFSTPEEDDEEE